MGNARNSHDGTERLRWPCVVERTKTTIAPKRRAPRRPRTTGSIGGCKPDRAAASLTSSGVWMANNRDPRA
jgi:hypothetical protein